MLEQHVIDGRKVELWIASDLTPESPLLLAHDGQNCFAGEHSLSGAGWLLDRAADRAAATAGTSSPVIVAPWNEGAKRVMEYGPEDLFRENPDWLAGYRALHGETAEPCGNAYLDWCVDRLLPWAADYLGLIVQRERTAVLGSSMGGLAALTAVARRPEAFECALCVSTHWASGDAEFVAACIRSLPAAGRHRLWFDHGDLGLDAKYEQLQKVADAALVERGWSGRFESHRFPGADHSERDWAARAEQVLTYWLSGYA